MSRQAFGMAPLVRGRSPRYTGWVGSVTSTKDVPSNRPTRAYSRPVWPSVQPHMSLSSTPRLPPIALTGRNDSRSMLWQPKMLALPRAQSSLPPTMGESPLVLLTTLGLSDHVPPGSFARNRALPAPKSSPGMPTTPWFPATATAPPNQSRPVRPAGP